MKMQLTIVFWVISTMVLGCTGQRSDNESDSDTPYQFVDTVDRSGIDTETASSTEEDTGGGGYDTADGLGGVDEECYTYDQNGTILMWCDTPDLITQQCDGVASECCCRASCEPVMCDGGDETLPCTLYDTENLLGYCDYAVDNVPVGYECLDICTPRSECLLTDTDGACLDTDAEINGVCLVGGDDTDAEAFCQPMCTISRCDEQHYCSPVFSGEYYDGTGACLPI